MRRGGRGRGAWQVIAQELGAGQRLYVEVWRYPWATALQVTVARLEQAGAGRGGEPQWRAIRTLRPEELALREEPERGAAG